MFEQLDFTIPFLQIKPFTNHHLIKLAQKNSNQVTF